MAGELPCRHCGQPECRHMAICGTGKVCPVSVFTYSPEPARPTADAAQAMAEALRDVTDCLERELEGRGIVQIFKDELEPDQALIDWLGEAEGRAAIGAVLRLRQARAILATKEPRHG